MSLDKFRCCSRRAMDPNSRGREVMEGCTLCICLHDVIALPVMLAWDPASSIYMRLLNLTFLIFWVSEMILTFFTGFYREGLLVTDLREVFSKYLRTTFLADLLTNVVDLAAMIAEFLARPALRHTNAIRVLRLGRLGRLARVAII